MSLEAMAREAGRTGIPWSRWTASDEVQERINASEHIDSDALETAYCQGRRELRIATWRIIWTTAHTDYDTGETESLEECGEWYGKKLRRVAIEPNNYAYQTSRYWSGLHSSWDEDPRIEEARAKERFERERAEREAREAKRQAGLVWLQTATEDELEDFDTFEAHGVRYDDVRAEKKRRTDESSERARLAEWKRCLALIPEGATLIDEGTKGERGLYGWIPGQPTHVYYNIRIVRSYPDEADHASVIGEQSGNAGSASLVADYLEKRRFRVATEADNVPPRAVVARIGQEHWKDIRRIVVDGKTVWAGCATFGETMVLDDKGHIVRSKKIVEAVKHGAFGAYGAE